MSKSRQISFLWLSLGLFFASLVFLTVSFGLTGRVRVTDPAGIQAAADTVLTAISRGDWQTLQQHTAGNLPLAPDTGEAGSAQDQIWQAYLESLSWHCADPYRVQGDQVTQAVRITCLDISQVTGAMARQLAGTVVTPETRKETLAAAAEGVLAAHSPHDQLTLTLTFVRRNSQWQVLPDQALLSLLSGMP